MNWLNFQTKPFGVTFKKGAYARRSVGFVAAHDPGYLKTLLKEDEQERWLTVLERETIKKVLKEKAR